MNDQGLLVKQPVSVMVTINGIAKHEVIHTYGSLKVLMAGIGLLAGIGRNDAIPDDLLITTKRITADKYYGGEA